VLYKVINKQFRRASPVSATCGRPNQRVETATQISTFTHRLLHIMSQPSGAAAMQAGKYSHPWMKSLPTGRAKAYDLAYKATTTLLAGFAAYGFFEVARGAWFIASAPTAEPSGEPSKPVSAHVACCLSSRCGCS
jgi:hypothetical protein